jgi:hypothetical protein
MVDSATIFAIMATVVVIGLPLAERFDRRFENEHSDSTCRTCGGHRIGVADQSHAADEV